MNEVRKKKILVLVEGEKTDVKVLKELFHTYEIDIKYQLVTYGTNIYVLYQEMFQNGIDDTIHMDLLQVLKSREKNEERKKIFEERYTDILLIFDLDPHDPLFEEDKIRKMQRYFNESSDMGKLYLNYPMVEAFYHLSSIPDPAYIERSATLLELKTGKYKERVNLESKGRDYRKFIKSRAECNTVILQNLSKAQFLISGDYLAGDKILKEKESFDANMLLDKQLYHIRMDRMVYVLCTCVFYIVDYKPSLLLK